MEVAELTAELSYAERLKVGCVIVKNRRILSIGYNGMPANWDNVCENEKGVTKDEVIHAEANALMKLASSTDSAEGAVLFVTHSPCMYCAKIIYQSNIRQIIYKYPYRDDAGLKFLKQSRVGVFLYDDLLTNKKNIGVIVDG